MNIDKDIEIVKQDLNNWKKEFGTEGSVAINIKSLENVLKELSNKDEQLQELKENNRDMFSYQADLKLELETYKKIAEKLAEYFIDYVKSNVRIENYIPPTIEELLDWARKEVENEENNSNN